MKLKLPNLLVGMLALSFGSVAAQNYEHLVVTSGYNEDVIANGTGASATTTSVGVDNANFAFMSNDFRATPAATPPAYALPATGLVTSTATPALSFQLNPYSQNNSLRITEQGASGTLTFTNRVSATKLFLLATAGSGDATLSGTITFTDNTTQSIGSPEVPDWYNRTNQPVAASGFGRLNRANDVIENPTGNPRMYQVVINIDLANQTKSISSIQLTKASSAAAAINIFGVTAEILPACPAFSTVTGAPSSETSAVFNWALATAGQGTGAVTYRLEVYTDATYTTHVTGSPFTGLTTNTYTLNGLTFNTQYYYRLRANNGSCDSAYSTGTFTQAYCLPTRSGSQTTYYVNNVNTTGGYTNIASTSPNNTTTPYNNYTTQIVSKPAGTSFNYNITRGTAFTTVGVWVDWNKDLDFDDAGETILISNGATGQPLLLTGMITIPTGTPIGNYKFRVRSTYYFNTTVTPCGSLVYGETEDYTISVVARPVDCAAPAAPTVALSALVNNTVTGTVTAPAVAPTGYILVRSSAPLTAQPVSGITYVAGNDIGGGKVVSVSATLTTFSEFLNANSRYYYTVYSYTEGSSSCFGPIFSTPASANVLTCAIATVSTGASNITGASAVANWTSVVGPGGTAATYTLEVYSDAALTNLLNTYTTANSSYALTGLTNGTVYYYRVKAVTPECHDAAWSATATFTAKNDFTPIDVTGFNADVIANGNGLAGQSTTASVDSGNFAYLARDYKPTAATALYTYGLPIDRILNSPTAGLTFLMQDYSANNALRLSAQGANGTLTFTTPVKLTNLYLAVTSGNGGAGITAQIMFSDGTSQTTPQITLINWDTAASGAIPAMNNGINLGRVDRTLNTGIPGTGNFKVFQVTIDIDAANQSKLITGIMITKSGAGATEPVASIFAVSGKMVNECPVVETATAVATSNGATINYTLAATSGTPSSYVVEVYTNATFTTPVTGSPFTGITQASHTVTGLNPLTTYYFRVRAANSTCNSPFVTGSFTTLCQAPELPIVSAQSFCTGATAAELDVNGVAGATFAWTSPTGTAVTATDVLVTGTYTVTQTLNGCTSAAADVVVTVNAIPDAPVANAAQNFCTGATVSEIMVTAVTDATLNWLSPGGSTVIPTDVLTSGTYTVTQTLNNCASVSTSIVVTINTTPVPTTSANQEFCTGATVANLNSTPATGATISWSLTDGGTALDAGTELVSGTYYVTQTLLTCTSTAVAVEVVVNAIPDAPTGDAVQQYNAGETVAALDVETVEGAAVRWYILNGEGERVSVLTTAELVDGTTYYVTQSTNDCESEALEVTVDQILSNGSFDLKSLTIYPNPAVNTVTISAKNEVAGVAVFNMLGQMVVSQKANGTSTQISVANLAQGNYILQVNFANGTTASAKIVKQ